jgi:hypothetical protein
MKKLFLFAFAISLLSFSCQKDDEHQHDDEGPYLVTIDIQSPTPGAIAPLGQSLPVKVVFDRPGNKAIHNIMIQVADMNNQVVAILWEEVHIHESGPYVFESDNYVPQEAGAFKLQAISTDMEGGSANLKEAGFNVE